MWSLHSRTWPSLIRSHLQSFHSTIIINEPNFFCIYDSRVLWTAAASKNMEIQSNAFQLGCCWESAWRAPQQPWEHRKSHWKFIAQPLLETKIESQVFICQCRMWLQWDFHWETNEYIMLFSCIKKMNDCKKTLLTYRNLFIWYLQINKIDKNLEFINANHMFFLIHWTLFFVNLLITYYFNNEKQVKASPK